MKRAIFAALLLSGCITSGDFSADSLLTDLEFSLPGSRVAPIGPGAAAADWRDENGRWLHVVAVDPARKGIIVRAALAHDRFQGRTEALDALARRKGAAAAVSVGYPDAVGFVTGGLTVLDRAIQFAPLPPQRPSLVIGRDYTLWFGKFHPERDTELDYDEALTGLWPVGEGHPAAPVGTREWTMLCRSARRGALLWIYAPDGGAPEADAARFKCKEAIIAAVGERAGLVVNGKNTATERGLRRPVNRAGAAFLYIPAR